ncbi:MAG: hypothetical protein ABR585_06435 [Gemmatimonadaceae bacterium]
MRRLAVAAALYLCAAGRAQAQLVPNDAWRTLRTQHFRVHFTQPLEEQARRAAVNAERAYAQLSRELVPPRGTIDLVISDNVDYVNGYATPFPSNRIVLFAHPPTDASGLRNYADWNALVVTHELTHIFHLDRSRGIWRVGQAIFGRNPFLFPNAYQPRWVLEGLAVYYESRLTGEGRLESAEHSMIARAAAMADRVPTLQELSPNTSRFPGGGVVYVYGSLLFDYLSRTRGPQTIRDFVERGAKTPLPFFLTPVSRAAFGMSFQTAWRQWRDSLVREMKTPHEVMPGWKTLTTGGRVAMFPRWLGDTSIVYAGDKGREMPAAYQIDLAGREKKFGRRNGAASPNVVMPDGSILFAQPDYVDPYHLREDLYLERNGHEIRLTRGARLTTPDARADGEIVAVQDVAATTRLVRVSADGRRITPITSVALDTQWADPRWSPDGLRIAAVRQTRGTSEIALLDGDGHVVQAVGATHAINSSPSWTPDGNRILFSSERNGLAQIYIADLRASPVSITRLTDAATGVFTPEVSPDLRTLAAMLFSADGDHIGTAPLDPTGTQVLDSADHGLRVGCTTCVAIGPPTIGLGNSDSSPSKTYSPWLSLLPRYWMPVFESTTEDGTSWGATTSGVDIVGRHSYTVEALRNTRFGETSAWLWYRYAGLGLPLLDLYASQNYSNSTLLAVSSTDTVKAGSFLERERIASLQATFVRPRFRNYASFSFGGELQHLSYSTAPDTLLPLLSPFYGTAKNYPAVIASAGWSNAQRPELSISPEDGISLSASGRQRWQGGTSGTSTRSIVGVTALYKSLDLPGFAHHVFALRGAGGLTDERSPDRFSAGGISGTQLEVFPGFAVGEQRRTFGVRGYPAGAEGGIRAYTATAEYRIPLAAPSRGFRFIPLFIDKTSLSVFGDMGRAYCPARAVTGQGVCRARDANTPLMSSVGAELNLDTGVQLDVQARVRLGVAVPLGNRDALRAKSATGYATFGASF